MAKYPAHLLTIKAQSVNTSDRCLLLFLQSYFSVFGHTEGSQGEEGQQPCWKRWRQGRPGLSENIFA